MRIAVHYQDEFLDFEVDDDRIVAHRQGPPSKAEADVRALTLQALEAPNDFPPLLKAVVPGDRVAIPIDPALPDLEVILGTLAEVLRRAEVDSITVIAASPAAFNLLESVDWVVHNPDDRSQLAYLATTAEENRVYLNRLLTDADIVIPVGTLGYDATLGYRGPWSVLFPGMSDRETLTRHRGLAVDGVPDRDRPNAPLRESSEVSWLLGCQFQLGVVPGASGAASIVAGLESAVRASGARSVDDAWSFPVEERADLVVAGIGAPGRSTSIDDLAEGLATAARLVRRGGKIVALSRAEGEPGPVLLRLARSDRPGSSPDRLQARESDPDFPAARKLATALAWADVYVLSRLDGDLVDDLGMIPLGRPEEARKLAASAASCTLLSHADRTRALVQGED